MLQSIVPDFLSKTGYLGLMLDYDGTLTPIVSRPEEAIIAPERVLLLKRLLQLPKLRLAIVSGRSIQQLEGIFKELLNDSIVLCGLHGGEIKQYPEGLALCSPSILLRAHLRNFKDRLTNALHAKGLLELVLLEDKMYSLALHYRLTPDESQEAAIHCFKSIYQASDSLRQNFRLQSGKKVLELLPSTFNKGACVQSLAQYWQAGQPNQEFYFTYVGDDLTDEHAFEAIRQLKGSAILINEAKADSFATARIESVDKLYEILEALLSDKAGFVM